MPECWGGGVEKPVAFNGSALTPAEQNYTTTEREMLAVIFAIEKYKVYLQHCAFQVVTDHSAVAPLIKAKDPKGRMARWVMKLQAFKFSIVHRPGR